MQSILVTTQKYDIALDRLLSRRLTQSGCVYALSISEEGVSVTVRTHASLLALSDALITLMCCDLVYFELAHRTDALPFSLSEKQDILKEALAEARSCAPPADARDALMAYLAEYDALNLEGYLCFRMRAQTALWARALEHASVERWLRREYAELLGTLVDKQPPRMQELSICLNADGSCTLSDDSDAMIEYVDGSQDGILDLLVHMAPARLTVYDLSDGRAKLLADAILQAFAGRVRLYR